MRIGKTYKLGKIRVKVIEFYDCSTCVFSNNNECTDMVDNNFPCGAEYREDNNNVQFIQVPKFTYGK